MNRILYFPLLITILLFNNTHSVAQSANNTWTKWRFLIGDWDGQGAGKPGDGVGGFSLQPDLDGKVLIRKNHAEYPATKDRPAFSHNDLMIISPDKNPGDFNAVYYDNEGHIINYAVSFNDSAHSIIFISKPLDNSPQFRLTYTSVGPNKVNIKFEIAPPGKPNNFSTYIEASATRKK